MRTLDVPGGVLKGENGQLVEGSISPRHAAWWGPGLPQPSPRAGLLGMKEFTLPIVRHSSHRTDSHPKSSKTPPPTL